MRQYDNGAEGLRHKAIESTVRITQFFDHYLKGIPPQMDDDEHPPIRLKHTILVMN